MTLYLVLSAPIGGYSQTPIQIEKASYNSYTDGMKTTKLHKFEETFAYNKEHHRIFKKFNRSRLTLKLINYSSILMVGATALAVNNSLQTRNDSSVPAEVVIAFLGLVTTATVIGLNNAIMIPIKNHRKDKLLNYSGSAHSSLKTESTSISLIIKGADLGLVYSF